MQEKFIEAVAMLFAEEAFSLARIWISIVLLIIFAMGLSAGADDRVVPASRILEQIRAGEPVEYDGFTITGDLDLDEMDDYLPSANETSPNDALCYVVESATINEEKKIVSSQIQITNSTIRGGVDFNNTKFNRLINIKNTKFEGIAGFRGAIFKEDAVLSNTQFNQFADFFGSIFCKHAHFNETQFLDYAVFDGAYFANHTNFSCNFKDIADFRIAIFNRTADFGGAGFNSDVNFSYMTCYGNGDFQNAVFNGTADFD
ncbi:MAG: pentapeptide repeat-containing protein, partial [Methanothrix sp.]|nr:pentapeptide repeat-containing protein [Methanothrix sp.]